MTGWRPPRLLAADLFEFTERDGDWAAAAAEDFWGDLAADLFPSPRPGMPAMSDRAMAPTVTGPAPPAVRPSLPDPPAPPDAAAAFFFFPPPPSSGSSEVRSTVPPDSPALFWPFALPPSLP